MSQMLFVCLMSDVSLTKVNAEQAQVGVEATHQP